MPYAENRGVRIYYEVEGEGTPLVLVHGFSDSLEGWREYGYAEELKKGHRLILIDARGHGDGLLSAEFLSLREALTPGEPHPEEATEVHAASFTPF